MSQRMKGTKEWQCHQMEEIAIGIISAIRLCSCLLFDLDELISKSYLFKHVYRNPNSVSSEDGMMETEQPISPPVQVVMPQSPSRNDYCLKRKADFDSNQSQLTNISQWNKSKNDGPKVRITF